MLQRIELQDGRTLTINDPNNDKQPVVSVHGLTGNHMQLKYFQDYFKDDRFITYDLSGRGQSDFNSQTSISHHANDLLELLDILSLNDVILVGYSIGAYICAEAAAKSDKVGKLVLLDGAGYADDDQQVMISNSLLRLSKSYNSQEDYINETKISFEKAGIEWTEHHRKFAEYESNKTSNGWESKMDVKLLKQDYDTFFYFQHSKILSEINVPTLLIIAKGNMGQRPLFLEESFNVVEDNITNLQVEETSANHLTLVFNQQPEVFKQIEKFIK
ncbi:alpha/beta hydrolase [Aquisalibacillus elongatus]|uniref:Pimeloyl-ACP methyl ester carboxylesterase n=1 Tax=Aquisalibacillus elongatus TaxID=485577 RepID=A0A3N5BA49_9BACI|nr:alpha/beta hydrolase [Aquisalibacillus elongatus]RPF54257.1 pimeloyl-ACP methyl ester carboxylesterase [Aquisalibacillus elongatus]